MNKIYVLIGGNIGERLKTMAKAKDLLQDNIGAIVQTSSIYETAAWGIVDQPDFLNQVLVIETIYNAKECMKKILSIENEMGRVRTIKNAARIIDIDILFFNNEIIHQDNLVIPHPEIQNRRFTLLPLTEISPLLMHPVFNQSMQTLLSTCKDELEVKLLNRP